jgi:hypothetical protein
MRRVNNRAVFVIDSDESCARASGQGIRGIGFPPSTRGSHRGFPLTTKIYTDEWGAFLSGYAPSGKAWGNTSRDMDMRADDVAAKFRESVYRGTGSLTASLLLASCSDGIFFHGGSGRPYGCSLTGRGHRGRASRGSMSSSRHR